MAGIDLDDTREDKITWTLENSGEYSAKSAYEVQFAGQITSNYPVLIWKIWAPPKCKFFVWLLLQDRPWTAARLQLRGWKNNYFCALCERNQETAQHLFFECTYSRSVWQLVASWSSCDSLNPANWRDELGLEDWYRQTLGTGGKKGHKLAILTLWIIWNRRNAVIFRGCWKTPQATFMEIKDMAQQWSLAGCKALRPTTVVQIISE